MYIKSITLDGFKSYQKHTEIHGFSKKFNAITGELRFVSFISKLVFFLRKLIVLNVLFSQVTMDQGNPMSLILFASS